MKRFAVPRKDGGVTILYLVPVAMVDRETGERLPIVRITQNRAGATLLHVAVAGLAGTIEVPSLDETPNGLDYAYSDPAAEIAKWHVDMQAEHEIKPVEIDRAAIPAERKYRAAWTLRGDALSVDDAKRAEIDAKPTAKSVAERIDALEAKATTAGVEAKEAAIR